MFYRGGVIRSVRRCEGVGMFGRSCWWGVGCEGRGKG